MQCFHWGRELQETAHTHRNYAIDDYRLHTEKT